MTWPLRPAVRQVEPQPSTNVALPKVLVRHAARVYY